MQGVQIFPYVPQRLQTRAYRPRQMRRLQKVFRLRLAALEKNQLKLLWLLARLRRMDYFIRHCEHNAAVQIWVEINLDAIEKNILELKKRNDGFHIRRLYFVSKFIFKLKQIIRAYLKKL